MKTMTVTEFKAHALAILAKISETQEPLILTKRGVPVAEVVPYRVKGTHPEPGLLAEMFSFEKDIVSPLGEDMWEAAR